MKIEQKKEIRTNEKSLQDFTESKNSYKGSCDARCRVCVGGHAVEVRELQRAGLDLATIQKTLFEKYSFEVSIASISRHLKNYKTELVLKSFDQAIELFEAEKSNLAKHQAGILLFIDEAFSDVYKRYKQGHYKFDVSELKGLLELYYKVLRDPDKANDEGDILALFQKFNSEAQLTDQGVLFRSGGVSGDCIQENEKRSEK